MIKLEQYRDLWLAEKMNEIIGFYPREFYCLDNFSSFGLVHQGVYYQTVEHAYQALGFKATAPELYEKIKNAFSAHEAQRIAYENKSLRQKDWDTIKLSIMKTLLREKLEQNPYVKKKLLQTEDYIIVEDSPKDAFWGWSNNRKGENNLGKLWMQLRNEIRNAI